MQNRVTLLFQSEHQIWSETNVLLRETKVLLFVFVTGASTKTTENMVQIIAALF